MVVMAREAAVYEERYRWSRRTASVVAAGVLAVLVAVGVEIPLLPTLILLAAGVLALLWGAVSRRVAVRVDARGVTLGGSPLRYRSTTLLVPWADITNVLLWQHLLPPARSSRAWAWSGVLDCDTGQRVTGDGHPRTP